MSYRTISVSPSGRSPAETGIPGGPRRRIGCGGSVPRLADERAGLEEVLVPGTTFAEDTVPRAYQQVARLPGGVLQALGVLQRAASDVLQDPSAPAA